jgi:hypothetical protein
VGGYPPTARGDHFSYQAIVFYIRLRANGLFGPDRLYNAIAAIFSVEFDFPVGTIQSLLNSERLSQQQYHD